MKLKNTNKELDLILNINDDMKYKSILKINERKKYKSKKILKKSLKKY